MIQVPIFKNPAWLKLVLDFLFGQPIATVRQVEAGIGVSDNKLAQHYIKKLEAVSTLGEITCRANGHLL